MNSIVQKILTIAIPTFNRGIQIGKQLNFLLNIIDDRTSIIVIDNCSDEDQFSYLNKFSQSIQIVRNKFNVGMYANVLRCFELCESEYLWVIGDDDDLNLDSLEIIRNLIEKFPNQDTIHAYKRAREVLVDNNLDSFIESIENFSDFLYLPNTIYKMENTQKFIRTGYRYAYSGAPHLVLSLCTANSGGKHFFSSQLLVKPPKVSNQERWSQVDVALGMPTLCEIPLNWSIRSRKNLNNKIYYSYRIELVTQQLNLLSFKNKEEAIFLFYSYFGKFYYNRPITFFIATLFCRILIQFPKIGHQIIKTVFYLMLNLFPHKVNFRSKSFNDFEVPDRLKRM